MHEDSLLDKFKLHLYYFIIGVISFISLVFLPMIGTKVGLGWNVPDTPVGWIVWVAAKLIIATINVLIFYSFMQQAKVNVKDNEKYKEALEILGRIKVKKYIPRSPTKWNRQQYGGKGVTIFLSTALATIAFTQALLTYDWIALIAYLFTIIMGIIFGILQMKMAEQYWTDEFYNYAKMIEEEQIHEELNIITDNRNTDSNINCISVNSESLLLDSYDSNSNIFDRTSQQINQSN